MCTINRHPIYIRLPFMDDQYHAAARGVTQTVKKKIVLRETVMVSPYF
jgi:hypothetical protein